MGSSPARTEGASRMADIKSSIVKLEQDEEDINEEDINRDLAYHDGKDLLMLHEVSFESSSSLLRVIADSKAK